jgi:two-component system LytT family sensor kinase
MVTNADNGVMNGIEPTHAPHPERENRAMDLLRRHPCAVASSRPERKDVLMRVLLSPAIRLLGTWLAVAVFFSAENVLVGAARHRPIDWQWDVYHEFVYALTWAAFTPLVLSAGRRWPLGGGSWWRTIPPHLGRMALLAPAQIVTSDMVHYGGLGLVGQQPSGTLGTFLTGLAGGIVWGTLTGFLYYWLILGIQAAFVYQRMYREQRVAAAQLEGHLSEARLESLRLQLHPHFLFNTLNGISAFVDADPERARRMIARLGELLRRTLDGGNTAELPLSRELDLLAPYLEIQRIRFGDRLSIELDVPAAVAGALVPTLMLQPLVENAVEHGVKRTRDGALVRLTAEREGDRLRLQIADNGPGPARGSDGVGLANTRARLAGLYGGAHRFELKGVETGGTVVTIELPFRSVGAGEGSTYPLTSIPASPLP